MRLLLASLLLAQSVFTANIPTEFSSFAGEYGGGSGTPFSFTGTHLNGPITALRIRENPSAILGIQVKYGSVWGEFYGSSSGTMLEVDLLSNEHITQVSGKYAGSVNELIFLTNKGRMFRFGQPSGTCFNDFPLHQNGILRNISGRFTSTLNSIGFHWEHPSETVCTNCLQPRNPPGNVTGA